MSRNNLPIINIKPLISNSLKIFKHHKILNYNLGHRLDWIPATRESFRLSPGKTLLLLFLILHSSFLPPVIAAPQSATYELKDYQFGGSGTDKSDSDNYKLNAQFGEDGGGSDQQSSTYKILNGLTGTQQANIPGAPTFTNVTGYDYNKLKMTLDTGSNPSDATFIVAISPDNFTTTYYVQADGTIGTSPVAQTYASWGGASGMYVIGLMPEITYYIKVKASQGQFTESAYSSSSNATTSAVTLTFDIDAASTDQSTSPPYVISFGDLTAGSVKTATDKIWVTIDTNAVNGGVVYVKDANTGLASSTTGTTITSATADLGSAGSGYGLQGSSKTQSSGGPLVYVAPFDGSGNNVGGVSPTYKRIFDTSATPIVSGRGSVNVKAKVTTTTPASTDYTDTLTLIAAGEF